MEILEVVYRDARVVSYVKRKVEEVSSYIVDTELLENRIYSKLCAYYLYKKERSLSWIRRLINKEVADAKRRQKKEHAMLFSNLSVLDDFGESSEFEPHDILANVEDAVLEKSSLNEKITGLASDDRERFTLNAWADGEGDLVIARTLASLYGGKIETHRSFVKRFRVKCQRKLAA